MKKQKLKFDASKGCQKISSFFTKKTGINKPDNSPKCRNLSDVISLDSDDDSDFVKEIEHQCTSSQSKQNKRKFTNGDGNNDINTSPELKRQFRLKTKDSKIWLSKKSLKSANQPLSQESASSLLKIKEPIDLLNSSAFKNSEKVAERLVDRAPSTSASSIKTPDKRTSRKNNSSGEKTPKISRKKTPKQSPIQSSDFKRDVFKNFFICESPSASSANNMTEKALLIQQQNEQTPPKECKFELTTNSYISPRAKIKTKLDFSSCNNTNSRPRMTSEVEVDVDKNGIRKENVYQSTVNTILDSDYDDDDDNFDWGNSQLILDQIIDYQLDLHQSQHCKIVNINRQISSVILIVKSTKNDEQAICYVEGFWMHLNLSIGDTIQLEAVNAKENWLIDNQHGYLILEPDYLISTTSVVNSVFCKRRAVFHEKIRGFEPTNKFMIVGSMVHALFEEVLRKNMRSVSDIETCAERILKEKDWIKQIYESNEPFDFIKAEFYKYITQIEKFVSNYVEVGCGKPLSSSRPRCNSSMFSNEKHNWRGKITEIDDIEENIWCPELGVKGKIDVNIINETNSLMPLEVKTGRASVSLEHRGQVLLYIMMLNKLGYKVKSGLLLYLKEGILKEIPASPVEKRDLLMLRNELAYFLTRRPNVNKDRNNENVKIYVSESHLNIPETIDNPCCAQCPYNSICFAYSKHFNEDLSHRKTLQSLQNKLDTCITKEHIDYFMHWSTMLSIEMDNRCSQKSLKDIYTIPPDERKRQGKCLIDLTIFQINEEINGTYNHIFQESAGDSNTNFMASGFMESDYVIISTKGRPAVATGFITNISMQQVTVSIDRTFILDTYESMAFLTYNLASLALILDTSDHSNQLRQIIVDRKPTSFKPTLPKLVAQHAKPIFKRLNEVQQRAVLKAIASDKYFLIRGMPGTGKTATIVALIELLVALNKSVLITSHTHSAVDNVCLKLFNFNVNFMRLGNDARIDPRIREYSEQNLTQHCTTPQELEQIYNSFQIFAVTCLGSSHSILSKRTFDVCIIDESTQVLQCSVFRPIYSSRSFILIGDPDQLPAVVRNQEAVEMGMSESLFERLQINVSSMITLNLNYRMNKSITELANLLTYNGELLIGSEQIANATIQIPNLDKMKEACKDCSWALKTLNTSLNNSVQFVDTGPVWDLNFKPVWATTNNITDQLHKCVNIFEAAIIFKLVEVLLKGEINPNDIAIIVTYKAQAIQLTNILKSTNIEINTVDQFQGKDRSIIIYSCSKSKDLIDNKWNQNKQDLLEDNRRLNVAITRAKHKLIIVGDLNTLKNYSTFKKIYEKLNGNVIRLTEFDGFCWEKTLETVTVIN